MRRRIVIGLAAGALALGFALPATSWASWSPPPATDEGRLAAYLPIARAAQQQVWPNSQCAGREVVHLHADAQLDAMDAQDGVGSISRGASIAWAPWGLACQIWMRSNIPSAWRFCTALVHEFGNTAGDYDNTTPGSTQNVGYGEMGWRPCDVALDEPPTPSAAAHYYVSQLLPAPRSTWRVTCTPVHGPHPRCRAERHHRTLHFAVRVSAGQVYAVEPI